VTTSYDVAVIGLGGMGSAAAWHLARRGHRVVGFEQFGAAHDRGSSHGQTRLVRQAYYEDARYVPLLLRAYELWDELESLTGRPALVRTGGLMVGRADGPVVTGSLASARRWDIPHQLLDRAEAARRFPTFRLGPDDMAVLEPGAGMVCPEDTVAAHVDLASSAGADLRFGTAVRGWEVTGGGVEVRTAGGPVVARHLVVCAGAWSGPLLEAVALPLVVERHVVHWFAPRGGPAPFAAGRHPAYLWEYADGAEFYGFPVLAGDSGAKVAFYHYGRPADPDHLDRVVTPEEADPLRAELADRIPDLPGRWLSGSACMYTVTPDHHFVIGGLPGAGERVTVAAGFSGHGFKFVPVVGEVLADLATTGTTALDLSLFDPSRFS
jgi:sarcosine oxidase